MGSKIFRRAAKRVMQHMAARLGPHRRQTKTPRLLILMYHRILPEGDPRTLTEEPGMMVTPQSLAMHLEVIRRHFEPIHLSQWLRHRRDGAPLPLKACAITFDDGWADNYEFALPVLRAAGVPATVFLVSRLMGTGQTFWPERLTDLLRRVALERPEAFAMPEFDWLRSAGTHFGFADLPPTPEQCYALIAHAKALADGEIHRRLDAIEARLGLAEKLGPRALLSWEQVREMAANGLIEMGSHTRDHLRLDGHVAPDELEAQVVQSKAEIETHVGRPVELFCYPNGDYTAAALDLVKRHYLGAVTTAQGWNSGQTDPALLRRIAVHEDIAGDEIAFAARISGWV